MIKICCVTYGELDGLVREAIERTGGEEIEFTVVKGLQAGVIAGVQRAVTEGAEVLMAGGANAKILENTFHLPVLHFKITDFDYLSAFQKGDAPGRRIAVVTYQNSISEKLKTYLERGGTVIENIIYDTPEELETAIAHSEAEVIIGAAHAVEVGERCGRQTVLIYPGVESILDSIQDARQMALEIRKIREQSRYANTVLRYTTNGVLLLDSREQIIDYNPAAGALLADKQQNLKTREIESVIENWCAPSFLESDERESNTVLRIGDREILEKVIKTGNNPRDFEGAVVILSKLDDVRRAHLEHETKALADKKKKGFEARKYFSDIIGESYSIKSCIADARVFAKSDTGVLIYGPTGVGKELFAQGIHNESRRSSGPFIAVNCGALTESLLEAELFGYDDGAFTGSRKGGKKGLFELAENGTLFLDEIGEISPMMQTKLLRVLQEREMMRVGGDRMIPVNVRVIAATNRDLEHMAHEQFRRDLLYRLNVLELRIPPLKDREHDAVLLFDAFFRQRVDVKLADLGISGAVEELIMLYPWPGNIREMQNVSERYCLYLEQSVRHTKERQAKTMVKAIGEERLQNAILSKYKFEEKGISTELVLELKRVLFYSREKIAQALGSSRTTVWRILNEKIENVSKST